MEEEERVGREYFLQSVSCPAGLTAVGQLVRRRVPEAVFLESIGQEVTFVLPYSGARDGTFARLFQDLDLTMSDLGLSSYGISDTTLEEVPRALAEGERLHEPRTRSVRRLLSSGVTECQKYSEKIQNLVLLNFLTRNSKTSRALTLPSVCGGQKFGFAEQKCEGSSANFCSANFFSWNRSSQR